MSKSLLTLFHYLPGVPMAPTRRVSSSPECIHVCSWRQTYWVLITHSIIKCQLKAGFIDKIWSWTVFWERRGIIALGRQCAKTTWDVWRVRIPGIALVTLVSAPQAGGAFAFIVAAEIAKSWVGTAVYRRSKQGEISWCYRLCISYLTGYCNRMKSNSIPFVALRNQICIISQGTIRTNTQAFSYRLRFTIIYHYLPGVP